MAVKLGHELKKKTEILNTLKIQHVSCTMQLSKTYTHAMTFIQNIKVQICFGMIGETQRCLRDP